VTAIHSRLDVVHSSVPSDQPRERIPWQQTAHARLVWEISVDQLVQPGRARIVRDNGSVEFGEVLPLLTQVAEAVRPGLESTGGRAPGSRPPASLGALSLLADIRTQLGQCCRSCDHPRPRHLAGRLREWAAHAEHWQLDAPESVFWAASVAEGWVREARQLLDPPPKLALRGRACPVCRASSVEVWSEEQCDFVRRPALSIDAGRAEAVCGACVQRWPLDAWARLAKAIAEQAGEHDDGNVTGNTTKKFAETA
jgi:hypothetical protein